MSAADIANLTFKEKEDNCSRIVEYANFLLKDDASIKDLLPNPPTKANFAKACSNGILMCKILSLAKPGLYDTTLLNMNAKQGFQVNANQQLLIAAIKDFGFRGYEKLTPENIADPDPIIFMEILEKVMKTLVFDNYSTKNYPDIMTVGAWGKEKEKQEEKKVAAPEPAGPMAKVKRSAVKKESLEVAPVRYINQQLRMQNIYTPIGSLSEMTPKLWLLMTKTIDPIQFTQDPTKMDDGAMAEATIANLKTFLIPHFLTKQEILDVNVSMFQWFFAICLSKMPLFNAKYENDMKVLAEIADEKEQRLKLWMEISGKMKFDKPVSETLKDHVTICYFLEEVHDKFEWNKINKGKLNNFKAQDNWKYVMSLVFGWSRFPPQIEVSQLSGGDIDKINVLMDMIFDKWVEQEANKCPKEAELLEWSNKLVAASGSGVAAAADCGSVGPAYLASLLLSFDPKSDIFFDAKKIADDVACGIEVMVRYAKFGIKLNVTPARMAAKDKRAARMALSTIRKSFPQ
jgi:hypothetical protein